MLRLLYLITGLLCLTMNSNCDTGLVQGVFTVPLSIPLLPINSTDKNFGSTEACSQIQEKCRSNDVTSLVSCILNSKTLRENIRDVLIVKSFLRIEATKQTLSDAIFGYITSLEDSTNNKDQRQNSSDHWLVFSRASLDNSNEEDFTQSLNTSLNDIQTQLRQCLPGHGFTLDEPRYMTSVKSSLNESAETYEGDFLCGASVCASMKNSSTFTDNCYYNPSNPGAKPYCVDKCFQFLNENDCTAEPALYGIYLTGTCQYDKYFNPYCDCGTSVGGVLQNFYDGNQCISSTFIVAMSATGGGFILILLVLAIIVVYRQRQFLVVVIERNAELQKRSAKYAKTDIDYTDESDNLERRHPTLSAIIGESPSRKNSYEFKPGKKFENQYDGSDLYPYLKKNQLGGSPRAERSSNSSSGNSSMTSSGVSNDNNNNNNNNNNDYDNINYNNMDNNPEKLTSL